MKDYLGAVLFVDILGINALTTAQDQLVTVADFDALGWSRTTVLSNQGFCAALLSTFRRNLMACRSKLLKVAQLSDCAFLWSADVDAVVEASRRLFWLNTKTGVLTRAGLTFGQIVEPEKVATEIGAFLCGDAATRAAGLERAGKGARIFVDRHLPAKEMAHVTPRSFSALTNATDFQAVDEFAWFSLPHRDGQAAPTSATMRAMTELVALLLHSPKFRWNAASPAGLVQVGATVERIGMEMRKLGEEHDLRVPDAALVSCETLLRSHGSPRSDHHLSQFLGQFRSQ